MKAMFNSTVIAESTATVVVEGNHYFPEQDVHMEYLSANGETSICPWKGKAEYFDVTVDGETAKGAVWMYPHPSFLAKRITGRYAFWRGVTVTE